MWLFVVFLFFCCNAINTGDCYTTTIGGAFSGDWWSGEYECLNNQGTHLATIYDSNDLTDFISECGTNNNCWIGFNNYYESDSSWYWLSHGVSDDTGLEIESFHELTGVNVSDIDSTIRKWCIVYNGVSLSFEVADCSDQSLNYSFICDDRYDITNGRDEREKYVIIPYKTNWFNGEKFCVLKLFCLSLLFFSCVPTLLCLPRTIFCSKKVFWISHFMFAFNE